MIRILFLFLTTFISINAYSQLSINEILASNITVIRDDRYNNYGDWIELYNGNPESINLNGYYLSDDPSNPNKFQISSNIEVGAHEYQIIWTDEKSVCTDEEVHTNFGLSSKGDFTAIYDQNGVLIDSISFGMQPLDVSLGRESIGNEKWVYFQNPTPKDENSGKSLVSREQSSDVVFSISGGFFQSGVSITLSADTDDFSEIRYTLDGSIPTEISLLYLEPIVVSGTQVIRAKTFSEDKLNGAIVTNTYFIGVESRIPIVSIATNSDNFYDDEYGIHVRGTNGISGKCSDPPANWNQDWERDLNFEYYNANKERVINQLVGTKIFGGCSRTRDTKSLAIYARSKYGDESLSYPFFPDKPNDDYKTIVLRNSGNDSYRTLLRDGFMQALVKDRMDLDYQGYMPSLVYNNGEFWGILNTREKINDNYVTDNYGLEDDEFDMLANPMVVVNGQSTHYRNMMDFVRKNDMTLAENYLTVKTMMDVDEFQNYFLANIYFNNEDWPYGNKKFWREKAPFGKWRWIMYDTDFGFGLTEPGNMLSKAIVRSELFKTLLNNETFKNDFIQTTASHLNTTFKPERCLRIIDSLAPLIAEHIPELYNRWNRPSMSTFREQVDEVIPNFAESRISAIHEHFKKEFNIEGIFHVSVSVNSNEFGYVTISEVELPNNFSGDYFMNIPIQIRAKPRPGYKFAGWSGDVTQTNPYLEIKTDSTLSLLANFEKADTPGGLFVNEFSADNESILADENGKYDDWIEIYNDNEFEVDIGGLFISDSHENPTKHRIRITQPESTTIPAKGYLVLSASGGTESVLDLDFKLGKSGEQIGLFNYDLSPIDTLTYDEQFDDSSISRVQDGSNNWILIPPTPGAKNTFEAIEGIYINEFSADNESILADENGEYEDWIEIYNDNDHPVDIGGLFLSDTNHVESLVRIPTTNKDSTTISPFGYLLLWADGKPENGILHIDFRLGASGEEIRLVDYDLVTAIDSITFGEQVEDKSYGRTGLADPEWGIMNRPTPLSPNFYILGGITPVQNDMEVLVFPNPFSQRVTIDWSHIKNSNATNLSIFDSSGRIVFNVCDDRLDTKQIQWDGRHESTSLVGEGIYFYHITIDDEVVSGRILFQNR